METKTMNTSTPSFYDPRRVGTLYKPDLERASRDAQAARLTAATHDKAPYALLLVDFQIDFCHADGALSVPGAVADLRRTIEWLFTNAERVKTIVASVDSHLAFQIFYPTWWADEHGNHPAPHTVIDTDAIKRGKFRPLREAAWSLAYVAELEERAKKALYLWPFHTMIGGVGQALDPALFEAIHWHAVARRSQPIFLQKGMIPSTEHYSPFEPEVKVPTHPHGSLNTTMLRLLETHERIYVAGEAKSHCVLEACSSMVRHFAARPEIVERIHFLGDCTSSVVVPGVDFDAMAERELAAFRAKGMRFVSAADAV
jgi:nicotinamidase-related amidase